MNRFQFTEEGMGKGSWDETIVKRVSLEPHLSLLLNENNGTWKRLWSPLNCPRHMPKCHMRIM